VALFIVYCYLLLGRGHSQKLESQKAN